MNFKFLKNFTLCSILSMAFTANAGLIELDPTVGGYIDTGRGGFSSGGGADLSIVYGVHNFNRQTILEFDLESLDAQYTINSASIRFGLGGFDTDWRTPLIRVSGFIGDGLVNGDDFTNTLTTIVDYELCIGEDSADCITEPQRYWYNIDVTSFVKPYETQNDTTRIGFNLRALEAVNLTMNSSQLWGPSLVLDVTAIVREEVPVPEPSTLAIFALGMIGLASRRFKKQS